MTCRLPFGGNFFFTSGTAPRAVFRRDLIKSLMSGACHSGKKEIPPERPTHNLMLGFFEGLSLFFVGGTDFGSSTSSERPVSRRSPEQSRRQKKEKAPQRIQHAHKMVTRILWGSLSFFLSKERTSAHQRATSVLYLMARRTVPETKKMRETPKESHLKTSFGSGGCFRRWRFGLRA